MEQVARLSLGSVEEETSDGEGTGKMNESSLKKFSVLREVVKLYMNEEASCKEENSGSRSATEGQQRRGESGPKQTAAGPEAPQLQVDAPALCYKVGDEGRRKDMIKDDDKDVALMRIASLQPEDGAFIRRTTG